MVSRFVGSRVNHLHYLVSVELIYSGNLTANGFSVRENYRLKNRRFIRRFHWRENDKTSISVFRASSMMQLDHSNWLKNRKC